MTNILKYVGVAIVGVVIGLIASSGSGSHRLGGVYEQVTSYFYEGLYAGHSNQFAVDNVGRVTVGASGTVTTQVQFGTCNLTTDTGSFAATSTKQFFCTVSGVASGDLVIADLPVGAGANSSGAGSIYGGFTIAAAYATTTNTIGITLTNLTGAATSSYAQATTSVEYRVLR